MPLITLLDGDTVVVNSNDDLSNLIYEKLGYDAYCMLYQLIQQTEVAYHQANTDFQAYEASLESAHRALQDVNEINDQALLYLQNAKRLDRAHLTSLLRENQTTILNEI